jgi:hypothetical protein
LRQSTSYMVGSRGLRDAALIVDEGDHRSRHLPFCES